MPDYINVIIVDSLGGLIIYYCSYLDCSSDGSGGVPPDPLCFFMSASHEKGLCNLEAWECVCKARICVRKIVEPVLTVSELTTLK